MLTNYRLKTMKHASYALFFLLLCLAPKALQAQNVLYSTFSDDDIYSINLATCETTLVASPNISEVTMDIWQMQNGLIYIMSSGSGTNLWVHDPSTGSTTLLISAIPGFPFSMFGLNDSILLINTAGSLYSYNINQNTNTLLGPLPVLNNGEIFEYNGQLYAQNIGYMYELELNPPQITQVGPLIPASYPIIEVCGTLFSFGDTGASEFNFSNYTDNNLCFVPLSGLGNINVAPDPFNNSGPRCNCTTESGNFTGPNGIYNYNTFTACGTNPITLNFDNTQVLDGDDNLVFVLATVNNATNVVQYDILQTYDQSIITFVPGVTQPNTWYSVYAIAGNADGSSVDLNDPCLDVSQAAGVYWYAGPTVSFDGGLPFCGGGCQNITATFTGIQPFNLTYSVSFGGGPPQTFNQVFNSSSAAIQICPPAGFSGSIQVQATNLSDAKCPCGP